MPQERAIEGPAVKPTIAPATAPTGPSTTAPDTAPRAASPARSCALASSEASSEPAISAATRNILMASPPQIMRPWDCENAAAERTTKRWNSTKKPASGIGCGRFGLFDGTNLAVICPTCQLARRVNSPARSAPPRRMLQSKATLGKRLPYGNLTGAERLHPPGIHVCMACDKLIRTPGADNDRGPSADIRSTTGKIAAMKNKAMIRMMVLVISIGTLSLTVASLSGPKRDRRAGQDEAKRDRRRLKAGPRHRRHGHFGSRSHQTGCGWQHDETGFGRRSGERRFNRQRDGGADRRRRKAKPAGQCTEQGHDRSYYLFESEVRRRRMRRQGNEAVSRDRCSLRASEPRATLKSQPGARSRPPDRWEG